MAKEADGVIHWQITIPDGQKILEILATNTVGIVSSGLRCSQKGWEKVGCYGMWPIRTYAMMRPLEESVLGLNGPPGLGGYLGL